MTLETFPIASQSLRIYLKDRSEVETSQIKASNGGTNDDLEPLTKCQDSPLSSADMSSTSTHNGVGVEVETSEHSSIAASRNLTTTPGSIPTEETATVREGEEMTETSTSIASSGATESVSGDSHTVQTALDSLKVLAMLSFHHASSQVVCEDLAMEHVAHVAHVGHRTHGNDGESHGLMRLECAERSESRGATESGRVEERRVLRRGRGRRGRGRGRPAEQHLHHSGVQDANHPENEEVQNGGRRRRRRAREYGDGVPQVPMVRNAQERSEQSPRERGSRGRWRGRGGRARRGNRGQYASRDVRTARTTVRKGEQRSATNGESQM
ncbi:hypothetical protein FGB62_37g130 [Gracilaria domingensis]|nr:hypothetical protein FGB62_37g130 [Gracilaria domingensis]